MSTNDDVVAAWGRRESAKSPSMHTDGHSLFSYSLKIGEWRDGLPVVFNFTAHEDTNPFGHSVPSLGRVSATTSKHVSLARRVGYSFQRGDVLGLVCTEVHTDAEAVRMCAKAHIEEGGQG
jgi:hypothetical protein